MALKDHKRAITGIFTTVLILFLAAFGLFSCTTYIRNQNSAYVDMSEVTLVQTDEPAPDAPAMCVHTTMGDIVAELYPEEAPVYVEQFTRLAEEGYYNNTYVFQVQEGVYFEAGTDNDEGIVESLEHEAVPREISGDLWPFRGAFCAPTVSRDGNFWQRLTGTMNYYCGTRFLVCNTIDFDADTTAGLQDVSEDAQEITDAFLDLGGIPNYSQQMTVFAQAYGEESLSVIDAITNVETNPASGEEGYTSPAQEIQITSIDIGVYSDFVSESAS